jgi:hypothetical protein
MSEEKKWFEVSEDELHHREEVHNKGIEPVKRAVTVLQDLINQVVEKLGVDITQDDESIDMQMQLMDIYINSFDREQWPKCPGVYISAMQKGNLEPFAYIREPEANENSGERFIFTPAYWNKAKQDYDEPQRVKIG